MDPPPSRHHPPVGTLIGPSWRVLLLCDGMQLTTVTTAVGMDVGRCQIQAVSDTAARARQSTTDPCDLQYLKAERPSLILRRRVWHLGRYATAASPAGARGTGQMVPGLPGPPPGTTPTPRAPLDRAMIKGTGLNWSV